MLGLASGDVRAQGASAHKIGLAVAKHYGIPNPTCYAQFFAKYAQLTPRPNGKTSWYVPSTPAHDAELRRKCGIDRLPDAMQESRSGPTAREGGAYGAGLNLAAKRGHTGSNASCYARTFARFASASPSENGAATYSVYGLSMDTYTAELFRNCGISR